jgi:hypothetical protein
VAGASKGTEVATALASEIDQSEDRRVRYRLIREFSEKVSETLEPEDCVVQTVPEASPAVQERGSLLVLALLAFAAGGTSGMDQRMEQVQQSATLIVCKADKASQTNSFGQLESVKPDRSLRGMPHPFDKLHPQMYASELAGTALLVFLGLSIVILMWGQWEGWWIYWLGPCLGAALAVLLLRNDLLKHLRPVEARLCHFSYHGATGKG